MAGCPRRRSSPLLLAAVGLWAGLAAEAAAQGSVATDRAALEALYDATSGPGWTDSTNWKTSSPLGEWFGVTTSAAGRVTALELRRNALTGSMPAELGELANLLWLDISLNDLSGPLPAGLGDLTRLRFLDFNANDLTGPIPTELGSLVNLEVLVLSSNFALTGPVPASLGNLTRLRVLRLDRTGLTGPIPPELGGLPNLGALDLGYSWGLSGSLPPNLRQLTLLDELNIFMTHACAPSAWRDWLATIEFRGRLCGAGTDVIIDLAVFYTSAARVAAGGAAAIAAVIDLMVAETNQIYAASEVHHRVRLVERSEVAYNETGDSFIDIGRLANPSDGHMDEVHAVRDRVGADLVHLIVGESNVGGIAAGILSAFGLTNHRSGGRTFAHELGHNMALFHDRYEQRSVFPDPAHGYVNQPGLVAGAPQSRRWYTVMATPVQCRDAGISCQFLYRFSNPHHSYNGDPLGVPYGTEVTSTTGPADAVAVLNVTGPVVALWRDRPAGANRPPASAETLPDRHLELRGTLEVDVSVAFVDPDGDPLTYTVSSSAPEVVTVRTTGARVMLTAVSVGALPAEIRVTAADPHGLSATQTFIVWVDPPANRPPEPVGSLAPLTIGVDEAAVFVEVRSAFRDPDDDALTYRAVSSSPGVASVAVSGSTVTVTAVSEGSSTVTVTATDAGGSNGTATQTFTVTVGPAANRPPEAVAELLPLTLGVDDASVTVEIGGAFRDPDGDALTYAATSSAPRVVRIVRAAGARVTLAAVALGRAVIEVTATDPDGLSATQSFRVRVTAPFTDNPIQPGVTPVRAVHFTELRARIDIQRREAGLASFPWTDPELRAGVTAVKLAHLLELREALAEAYASAGRSAPRWTDASPPTGSTPIRALHLTELRAAVLALE